jgi:hypothetical protein
MPREQWNVILDGNSDTVNFDAARSGSLMRRMESIAKPAELAAA